LTWHKVLGLQGHVTIMWGHIIVSTVRRSWGRTAVRPDKKFTLQSSVENW